MARDSSGMLMATSTKVIGKMTKLTVMDCISMLMEQNTWDSGKTTCSMEEGRKLGPTAPSMRVTTGKDASMDKANTLGSMAPHTREDGKTIKSADMEHTSGPMVGSTLETGRTTTCMVRESTHGQTEDATRENI